MNNVPWLLTVATYATLFLAVLSLWYGRLLWPLVSLAAVALGYASGILTGSAALWIVLLAAACALIAHFKSAPASLVARGALVVGALGVIVLGLLLGIHALPGFHNLLVAKDITLTPGAVPYTLYLNFDKTMVGILLLGALRHPLIGNGREWARALRSAAPVVAVTVLLVIAGSLALGYVRLDPKWHALFWIWAPANLLMTCLSEEAFFRGFVQREVRGLLGNRAHAGHVAIAIGAIMFGAAHLGGGPAYAVLATVAGAGYGYVYERTGRIEMAMLTHFALNVTHFLLFTYPRVAP